MYAPNLKISFLALMMAASVCNAQPAAAHIHTSIPAAPAIANSFSISASGATSAAEIQKINESMTILSARLAQLELQAKIAVKQKEINGLESVTNVTPLGSAMGAPSVVSVAGIKGRLEAVLIFSGGVVQRVKSGDVIGDRKVSMVAINEVVLTDLNGKNLQRLAFGSAAVTKEANSSSSPMQSPFGGPPSGPPGTLNR